MTTSSSKSKTSGVTFKECRNPGVARKGVEVASKALKKSKEANYHWFGWGDKQKGRWRACAHHPDVESQITASFAAGEGQFATADLASLEDGVILQRMP